MHDDLDIYGTSKGETFRKHSLSLLPPAKWCRVKIHDSSTYRESKKNSQGM
jgi:hypothetical protein